MMTKRSYIRHSLLGVLGLFLVLLPLRAEMKVSLLTSAPYEGEVYTLYGHAALRIQDEEQKLDLVFNYGLFSFSQPNFIYRFAKGETDYMLGACRYSDYIVEYQMRGSTVTEQVLNLTPDECRAIWQALEVNYQPQNRTYRYNFFFDNCATRLVRLIEQHVSGSVQYHWQPAKQTFRDMINTSTRKHPWLTFGCDLALGQPTDREATPHEMMFLPAYMKEAMASATIVCDTTERNLVRETNILPADEDTDEVTTTWLTPLVCAILLLFMLLGVVGIEWKRATYCKWADRLLFTVAGLGGCILFFLSFISEHPCTSPNWNLLWMQPLHLLVLPLSFGKKCRKAIFYYHFINFVAISALLMGGMFLSQHVNTAVVLLAVALWMRSLSYMKYAKQTDKTIDRQ